MSMELVMQRRGTWTTISHLRLDLSLIPPAHIWVAASENKTNNASTDLSSEGEVEFLAGTNDESSDDDGFMHRCLWLAGGCFLLLVLQRYYLYAGFAALRLVDMVVDMLTAEPPVTVARGALRTLLRNHTLLQQEVAELRAENNVLQALVAQLQAECMLE
ncbi:hypothetical protein AURDEDRAFT_177215 [Auricularia subglabra TFB-10046 SS5]|uniref:Uncharacterized protein n=1 Tax=Auricularia subglabra (strain TFB-10046 / SS5) TaxID=717982 RepID=J0D4M3_AURST|nr:hypothetical protein AURDEDRAFT_177215 [Auricularia subglabra TFB-10046 SS5]